MGGGQNGDKSYERTDLPPQQDPPASPPGTDHHPPASEIFLDKNGQFLINRRGLEVVQHFEGCYLKAYQDSVGVWTIGWGRINFPDGRKVKSGDTCTQAQADAWLLQDLYDDGAQYIRKLTEYEDHLNADQFSALVGFTYNRGSGRYDQKLDDLVDAGLADKVLTAAESKAICDVLVTYNWAIKNGRQTYLLGLDRRRWAERYLFEGRAWRAFDTVTKFNAFKARGYK